MAYEIQKTDDVASSILVADGAIDSSSLSISLIGRGYDGSGSGYGNVMQNNIVRIMENFSNVSPPANPTYGQLWFDNINDSINVWQTDNTWRDLNDFYDGSIYDIAIAPDAAIQLSKLEYGTDAQIIVNNASGIPSYVDMAGDVIIDNTGLTTIQANAVGTAEIQSGINLDASALQVTSASAAQINIATTTISSTLEMGASAILLAHDQLEIYSSSTNQNLKIGATDALHTYYTSSLGSHSFNGNMLINNQLTVGNASVNEPAIVVQGAASAYINLYGDGLADSGMYFGQDTVNGGLIKYQASSDQIQFIRRQAGVDTITAFYVYSQNQWLFNGDISMQGAHSVTGLASLEGAYGNIASSNDEWLRLNDGGTHTNGIYTSSRFRADGGFQVGTSGVNFNVDTSGNIATAGYITANGYITADYGEFAQNIYVGSATVGGNSEVYFWDTNSATWRALYWSDTDNALYIQDNSGTGRLVLHSGNADGYVHRLYDETGSSNNLRLSSNNEVELFDGSNNITTMYLQYSGTPADLKGPGGATIWMDSNDGAGSGLDADRFQGYNLSAGDVASTVALRDSSGDITTRLFRSQYSTLSPTPNYIMVQTDAGGTGDNYIRPASIATIASNLPKVNDSAHLNGYGNDPAATGNSIVQRTSSGYINATYFNSAAAETTAGATNFWVETGNDGYMRKQPPANARTSLDVYSKSEVNSLVSGSSGGSWNTILSGKMSSYGNLNLSGFSATKTMRLIIYGTWWTSGQLPYLQFNGYSTATAYTGFYTSTAGGAPQPYVNATAGRLGYSSGYMTQNGWFTMEFIMGLHEFGSSAFPFFSATVWDESGQGTFSQTSLGVNSALINQIYIFGSLNNLFNANTIYKLDESTSTY